MKPCLKIYKDLKGESVVKRKGCSCREWGFVLTTICRLAQGVHTWLQTRHKTRTNYSGLQALGPRQLWTAISNPSVPSSGHSWKNAKDKSALPKDRLCPSPWGQGCDNSWASRQALGTQATVELRTAVCEKQTGGQERLHRISVMQVKKWLCPGGSVGQVARE